MSTGSAARVGVYGKLTDVAAATYAIVGTNVFLGNAPDGQAAPYIIWQGTYAEPAPSHTEPSGDGTIRHFQFACFAATPEAAAALRDAVVSDLDGVEIVTGEQAVLTDDNRDDYDPVVNLHRADADFSF